MDQARLTTNLDFWAVDPVRTAPGNGREPVQPTRRLVCWMPGHSRLVRLRAGAVVLLATVAGLTAIAQDTNQPVQVEPRSAQVDYSNFRIITERNIFAARRSGRVTRGVAPRPQRRVEIFTLVGTLEAGNGAVAFFDGTSAEYRKGLRTGDTIAGFKLVQIGFKGVVLENEQGTVELRVGSQMRLDEDGQWRPSGSDEPFAGHSSAQFSAEADRVAGVAETTPTDPMNEVLRRLMQQREQELQ